MRQKQSHKHDQEQIQKPPATFSIFPAVEKELLMKWNTLEWIGGEKNVKKYRSRTDFWFCELYPEWREKCFRYYEGTGPLLREEITEEQKKEASERMLVAIEIAFALHKAALRRAGRKVEWTRFQRFVRTYDIMI